MHDSQLTRDLANGIDLVYASSTTGSENYSSEPPLGPIALYSSLPERLKRHTRFLDSTILSQGAIEEAVHSRRAAFVCFSCTTFNYQNAIRTAHIAKRNGAFVIVGGIHVTHLRNQILNRMLTGERPFDVLVTGYGEPVFGNLLQAVEMAGTLDNISNLGFVRAGQCIMTKADTGRFGYDPLFVPLDYSQIELHRYSAKFHGYGNLRSVKIAGSMFTQRGCPYVGDRKCVFCSIEQINPRRSAYLVESDIVSLIANYNADHIRINDGDFTANARHMEMVAAAAESAFAKTGQRPSFYCFARADELDERRIHLLRRLNIKAVFIGYESGSNQMLRSMHKFTTAEQNLAATVLLGQHGIEVVCGGLVLGAQGESELTLAETLDFVHRLKNIGNVQALVATPMIPLPGSPSFPRLLEKLKTDDSGLSRRLATADCFNVEEITEIWNAHMSSVSWKRLLEVVNEIENIFRIGIRLLNFR